MADVLKYRVKIFSILLPLLECCQLHFHLGTGRCLWGFFILMFPTRLVGRVLLVGKVVYLPSAVGLVPCMQGWLYSSWGRGEVSWELQPHGSFVLLCVCFTSWCLQYIRAVKKAQWVFQSHLVLSSAFSLTWDVEGRAGDIFHSFLSPSMLSHGALCPLPQQGSGLSWLCSCSAPGSPALTIAPEFVPPQDRWSCPTCSYSPFSPRSL